MKSKRRQVNGVLLLDKPLEFSSNQSLQHVKRLFNAEKAGHTGTLDPLATGLLPVCMGEATKFSSGMLDSDKTYQAKIRLGEITASGDCESEVIERKSVSATVEDLQKALLALTGEILQIPPMHSALKFQGKPLYEYIRKGETIEREPRAVIIHDLELIDRQEVDIEIKVRCSKGTYIRTLAEDIGKKLGCGAHLRGLRRIGSGIFSLEQTYTIETLQSMELEQRDNCLLPVDCMLEHLPIIKLSESQVLRLAKGQRLGLDHGLKDGEVRIYADSVFAGLGEIAGRRLAPVRLVSRFAILATQKNQQNMH